MSSEWWFNEAGDNMLKGVEGDPDNPIRISDEDIVDFLMHIPQARFSFDRLLPTMLPAEQDRLNYVVSGAAGPWPLTWDNISDHFQHRFNISGVRRGGGWCPPPFTPP